MTVKGGDVLHLNSTAATFVRELSEHDDHDSAVNALAERFGVAVDNIRRDLATITAELTRHDVLAVTP